MHSVSSTLATMVVRAAAMERLSEPLRGCPKEFEDSVYRALAELHCTRPRLITFAPTEALKRVLALLGLRQQLDAREERQPAPARLTVTARGMATKIALSALATTLIAGAAVPAIAGVSHRELQVGGLKQKQEHALSAAGKRKGNKKKTITRTFSNTGQIAVPDESAATPFPAEIAVSGFTKAKVRDVNVVLRTFSHGFPDDVDVLLVAPNGRNALVMSDVGGSDVASNVTLTLDDEAVADLPAGGPLLTGAFRPANEGNADEFPAPSPLPSENVALSVFDGGSPNGEWKLFVLDEGGGEGGNLAGGWTLEITAQVKSKIRKTR
jgi:subtilisin-like proprotein convertase family protein